MKFLVWFIFVAIFTVVIADDEDAILQSTGIVVFTYIYEFIYMNGKHQKDIFNWTDSNGNNVYL